MSPVQSLGVRYWATSPSRSASRGPVACSFCPGGIPTTIEHLMTMGPVMYVAMLAGPSVAGLLMTSLVSGRSGLREVLERLTTWRVAGAGTR